MLNRVASVPIAKSRIARNAIKCDFAKSPILLRNLYITSEIIATNINSAMQVIIKQSPNIYNTLIIKPQNPFFVNISAHLLGLEDYVKILPIKANTVLNYNGSEYLAGYSNSTAEPYITDAVKFAYENGADIVSMSMSANENSKEAFNFVEYSDKMVFVAAAGNTGKMEMTYPAATSDY